MARNFIVKINSVEKIEQLLQEIYDQSVKQYNEIQNEMNKLSNSCNLADVTIEEKTKYSKAIHDLFGDKEKVLKMKFEVSKLMSEFVKHGGSVEDTLNDSNVAKNSKLDINAWKQQLNEIMAEDTVQTYELKTNKNKM
jgi:hypothetical protein